MVFLGEGLCRRPAVGVWVFWRSVRVGLSGRPLSSVQGWAARFSRGSGAENENRAETRRMSWLTHGMHQHNLCFTVFAPSSVVQRLLRTLLRPKY